MDGSVEFATNASLNLKGRVAQVSCECRCNAKGDAVLRRDKRVGFGDPLLGSRTGVRTVDVGVVKKQRWNGCPTGDGRVEASFVE